MGKLAERVFSPDVFVFVVLHDDLNDLMSSANCGRSWQLLNES